MTAILIIVASLYFLVILAVIAGLVFRNKDHVPTREGDLTVSVIIAARNEEKNISQLLDHLGKQDYPAHLAEYIIIDDCSEDQTGRLIDEYIAFHPQKKFRLLRMQGPPSKKKAVAAAIASSVGDLIITTDADCIHPPAWIMAIAGCFKKSSAEMILGPVVFEGDDDLFQKLQSLEFMGLMGATAGSANAGFPLMCNGANLAYSRKAFLETGGFAGNERFSSGDDQFMMMKIRKKYGKRSVRFCNDSRAVVSTSPAATFGEFFHQRLRWVSKNKGYTDPLVITVAVITWLFSFSLTAGIFIPGMLHHVIILFMIKMAVDFIPVVIMASSFKKKKLLYLFPFAALLNVPYVVFAGALGMMIPYRWKGTKRVS